VKLTEAEEGSECVDLYLYPPYVFKGCRGTTLPVALTFQQNHSISADAQQSLHQCIRFIYYFSKDERVFSDSFGVTGKLHLIKSFYGSVSSRNVKHPLSSSRPLKETGLVHPLVSLYLFIKRM